MTFFAYRTQVKNLMVQTLVPGQMRRSPGVKSVPMRSLLRCLRPLICLVTTSYVEPQVFADATLVFPLLVAATFAQD
jgi:hypothetical protein